MTAARPLVLVTGPPGTGKTTLASRLAPRLGLPVFHKDVVKEALFEALPGGGPGWSARLGAASNEVLWRLADAVLASGCGVVLESNFRPDPARPAELALRARHDYVLLELRCRCSRDSAMRRFRARAERGARHPGHRDVELAERVEAAFDTYPGGPVIPEADLLVVDTEDWNAVDIGATAGWVVARVAGRTPGDPPG